MGKKYLVQTQYDSETFVSLLTQVEIVSRISMRDCSDEKMFIYDVSTYGKVKPLAFHGTWHEHKDPLYIKVTDMNGNTVFDGYGEEH